MRKTPSKLLVLLIVLVFSAFIFTTEILASNSEDIATASIEGAENALVSAYQAVLQAEEAGANVSGLLAQLNDAGEFLAEAQVAFRLEDFDNAIGSADQCKDVGIDVENEAYELKNSAWHENIQRLWLTIMGSVLGVIVIVSGSFWAWRFLKRRYP